MFLEPLIVFQLISLDYVLETERNSVFGPSFSFKNFSIESLLGPKHPNEYNCGIFVYMLLNDCSLAVNSEITPSVSDDTIYRYNFLLRLCDLIKYSTIVVVQLGKSTPPVGASTGNILYKYPS